VLGRAATAISVLDVIQAFDPIHRVERCPLGRSQHHGRLCPLHRRLDQAVALVEQAFGNTTIAELSAEAAQEQVLCAADASAGEGPEVD
jgi:DNA-binding IscR family transcriptional regulator